MYDTYYVVTDKFDNLIGRFTDPAMAEALIHYIEAFALSHGINYYQGELFIVNEFVKAAA